MFPCAPFSSVPESFFFSGRTGHPPTRLGWSPVVPGKFGKEMARNETRFLEKPLMGPRRRYGRKWPGRAKNPLAPLHRGRTDIIGTGVVIVFSFPSEFFSQRPGPGCQRRGLTIPPATGIDPLPRWSGAGIAREIVFTWSSVPWWRSARRVQFPHHDQAKPGLASCVSSKCHNRRRIKAAALPMPKLHDFRTLA